MRRARLALAFAATACAAAPAHAALTADAVARVAVRPQPGAAEPLALALTDADSGRPTTLAQAARGAPLVLVFADFGCTTLCGPALAVAGQRLAETGERPGPAWRLAVVGLQPGAPLAPARAFADARLPPDVRRATTVMTGDAQAVQRATGAAGYGYVWDPAARQFAHPVAAFVLAPDGRIVRTLSEVALTPAALSEALADARAGRVGSLMEQVALICHGALEAVGRFDPAVIAGLRAGSATLLLGAPALLLWWSRRRRRA